MALRTKCDPLVSRALAATKLDRVKYAHGLFVLLPETLQLLLCLLMIDALNLKSRLKVSLLRLQNFYFRFLLRRVIKRKRKALTEHVRHRNLFEGVSRNVDNAHMSPNGARDEPPDPKRACARGDGRFQPADRRRASDA